MSIEEFGFSEEALKWLTLLTLSVHRVSIAWDHQIQWMTPRKFFRLVHEDIYDYEYEYELIHKVKEIIASPIPGYPVLIWVTENN